MRAAQAARGSHAQTRVVGVTMHTRASMALAVVNIGLDLAVVPPADVPGGSSELECAAICLAGAPHIIDEDLMSRTMAVIDALPGLVAPVPDKI